MGEDPHFRRTARQPLELRVRFRRDADDAPFETRGRLVDLGMGGAQIACERPPSLESRLRVELTTPTAWDPLDLRAQVRWADAAAGIFGVAFDSLSRKEATALYHLLSLSRFEAEGREPGEEAT